MSTTSLCFKEALDARNNGTIGLEESLKHIVAHYVGLKHETDAEEKRPYFGSGFADEVRTLVLGDNFKPLDDDNTALIYAIFLNAYQGDIAGVRKHIASFTMGSDYYLRPLVRIAATNGNPELLRICFENGHTGSGYLDGELLVCCQYNNNPSTAWFDVLFEFDFRQWRTDPKQLGQWLTWRQIFFMGPECTRWWIEHGGSTPGLRGLFEYYTAPNLKRWPGAATIRVLLDRFGIEWFKDSGTLQLAVNNHDFEAVKMLVEAGADVNEEVTDWLYDVREHRQAPLPALREAVYARSEEMIVYLAAHGAMVRREWIEDKYNTTPEKFKVYKKLVADLGAVKDSTPALM